VTGRSSNNMANLFAGAADPDAVEDRLTAAHLGPDAGGNESDSRAARSASNRFEVGYARPPVATRFQPGQSGNPRGRPKGARNLSTIVAAALGERVAVNENGKRRRISKMEAIVKQLVNRAASGEARATQLLLALVQAQEAQKRSATASADTEKINEADAFVMAELARRLGGAGET
jgi:hypothetical protein